MTEDERIAPDPGRGRRSGQPEHIDQVLHPQLGRHGDADLLTTGLGASPGAGVGRVYFTADAVVDAVKRGSEAILVRKETSPEDIHGMEVGRGRPHRPGRPGQPRRGRGPPVGQARGGRRRRRSRSASESLHRRRRHGRARASTSRSTGPPARWCGARSTWPRARLPDELTTVLGWADEIRAGRLEVRANADTARGRGPGPGLGGRGDRPVPHRAPCSWATGCRSCAG